eukprot:TRINITY_DN27170_c0_g3_i1.p2 TRINITY_DN27170_c0_g3~~TRINITY_DN27170_c0_g3_i1.p2  ORF type:complete len:164 (-),score=30.64 TRINITY_DN27170_c0_g3_i1:77-568(-)
MGLPDATIYTERPGTERSTASGSTTASSSSLAASMRSASSGRLRKRPVHWQGFEREGTEPDLARSRSQPQLTTTTPQEARGQKQQTLVQAAPWRMGTSSKGSLYSEGFGRIGLGKVRGDLPTFTGVWSPNQAGSVGGWLKTDRTGAVLGPIVPGGGGVRSTMH